MTPIYELGIVILLVFVFVIGVIAGIGFIILKYYCKAVKYRLKVEDDEAKKLKQAILEEVWRSLKTE